MGPTSKEGIRKQLEGYVFEYTRKIDMWKRVKLVTKKDGTEFKVLSKNFENAQVFDEFGEKKLKVSDWNQDLQPHYMADTICLKRRLRDWHGETPSPDRIIQDSPRVYPYFYLNAHEAMQAVQDTIAYYENQRDGLLKQLPNLDEAYAHVEEVMKELRIDLGRYCGNYNTSLFYALTDRIRKFPN